MMRRASTHPRACATNATDALPACATGKEPMCVGSCPLRALEFGPIEELREKYGDCAQVPPMAAPATRPNIVIGTCQAVDSETYNLDEGYVANPLEVE